MSEMLGTPHEDYAQPRRADSPVQPEPRFATFYGVRQIGTSAYCTPSLGSDQPQESPTKGKPVRPFALKPGPEAKVITTVWALGGKGGGADTH